ncbi:DUF4232 domain-containing protein [Streptomyces sp. Je 1-332]|uniref:DUF4232 domain-containing protein n=1 Tax=Streptomyces sp. Je 1-332 TaxID=3231270 RepID=UPI0034577A09
MSSHVHHRPAAATRTMVAWAAAAACATPLVLFAGPPASAAPASCRTNQLQASWSDAGSARSSEPTGEQETAVVQLRNSSDATCTLQGHPDVALTKGTDEERLHDTSKPAPKQVSLAPGESTTFTFLFLSEKDEPRQAISPTKAIVTPPDNKASSSLPWKWGPVTRQEAATHPGNVVGPVGATLKVHSGSSAGQEIQCGNGWNGLAVTAITSKGKDACPTAQKVSSAFGKVIEAKKTPPVTVTVNGTAWKCQEKQEKGAPNPYTECVSTKEPAEKVQLTS